MEAKALYNLTIVAVCPDGTEIVVRSGWTERGHLFVSRKPVSSEEEFEVLRRAAASAIESGLDVEEALRQGLALIARAKKLLT
jgi:hypothetical protein